MFYHCWLITIDHRCEHIEHIESSCGWDMGWISGYSPHSPLLLRTNEVPRGSAKTGLGPGYQIISVSVVFMSGVGSSLGSQSLTGNISNICHQLPISPPPTPHTRLPPVSSCSHQSQLRRWKHGWDFICIGGYNTCLFLTHASFLRTPLLYVFKSV